MASVAEFNSRVIIDTNRVMISNACAVADIQQRDFLLNADIVFGEVNRVIFIVADAQFNVVDSDFTA